MITRIKTLYYLILKFPAQILLLLSFPFIYFFGSINEEALVVFCFFAALYFLYFNLEESVVEALDERSEAISKDLHVFYDYEKLKIEQAIEKEKAFSEIIDEIKLLTSYYSVLLENLKENQRKSLRLSLVKRRKLIFKNLQNQKDNLQSLVYLRISKAARELVYSKLAQNESFMEDRFLKSTLAKILEKKINSKKKV